MTIVQSEDVIIKIRGLSILGRLHAHENQSAGVDVINAQGICSGSTLPLPPSLPPPPLLSFPAATHLSITHGPLGIPSSVEILKL